MDDFVNLVNRNWETADPVALAAFALWRINHVHPFINGNGRTARAACYFVLCVKLGGWLPGQPILPELLRQKRDEYVTALKAADQGNLNVLHEMISTLLDQQIASANEGDKEA